MFLDITQGAVASTLGTDPLHQYETVRHLLFGSLTGVRLTIQDLHKNTTPNPTIGVNPSLPDDPTRSWSF